VSELQTFVLMIKEFALISLLVKSLSFWSTKNTLGKTIPYWMHKLMLIPWVILHTCVLTSYDGLCTVSTCWLFSQCLLYMLICTCVCIYLSCDFTTGFVNMYFVVTKYHDSESVIQWYFTIPPSQFVYHLHLLGFLS